MRNLIGIFLCVGFIYLMGCTQSELSIEKPSGPLSQRTKGIILAGPKEFTGNEVTYPLISGSLYDIGGVATIKEKIDGSATVAITLNGVKGGDNLQFPVHLHFGEVSTDKADVAAVLQPVDGRTWKSQINLNYLADESPIGYSRLKELNACIKIHLSATGEERNIILPAGNIGSA